jgi:hypothetical protein
MSIEAVIGIAALLVALVALLFEVRRASQEAEEREAERIRGAAHMLSQSAHLQASRLEQGEALLSAPRYVLIALKDRLPEQVRTVEDLRTFLEDNPWMTDVVTAEGWMLAPLMRQVVDEMQRLLDPARDMSGGWGFVSIATQRLSMLVTGTGESEVGQPGKLPGFLDPWDAPMAKLPWALTAQLDPDFKVLAERPSEERLDDTFFKDLERQMCSIAAGLYAVRSGQAVKRIALLLDSTARHIDRIEARKVVAIGRGKPQPRVPNSAKEQMESCAPLLEEHGEADLAALVRQAATDLDAISRGDQDLPIE